MKAAFILFLMLLLSSYASNKIKFKYLDLSVPLYIDVNSLPKDADDGVSKFLKDTLIKVKANLISYSRYDELMKRYLEDIRKNTENLKQKGFNSSSLFNDVFARGTSSQSFSIQYTSLTDPKATIESCDSIGFSFLSLPPKSMDQKRVRKMWHIKEIATRSNDSIALFLLKQM